MTTRGQLTVSDLNFLNAGDNFMTLTATSDGNATFSATSGDVILSGVKDPLANQDAATKNYVDSIATAGATWKNSVSVATDPSSADDITGYVSGNILSFPPSDGVTTISAIDGVTLVLGDRVLVKNQTDPIENGIYVVQSTWVRSDDMPLDNTSAGSAVWVNEGNISADKGWIIINDDGNDIVGTHGLNWTNFAGIPGLAGNDTEIQFNNDGNLGASSNFTFDYTAQILSVNSTARTVGALTVPLGSIILTDGDILMGDGDGTVIGAAQELTLTHAGSSGSGSLTNTTGDLLLTNSGTGDTSLTNTGTDGDILITQTAGDATTTSMIVLENTDTFAGSNIEFKLGTNDGSTSTIFTNSDSATIMSVGSDLEVVISDDTLLSLGNGSDFTMEYNSTTNDTTFDNTDVLGFSNFQLGTDTSDTGFQILNDTGSSLFSVLGDGTSFFTGSLTFNDNTTYIDDVQLQMGDAGTEFVMVHTSAGDQTITNNEGNLSITLNDSSNNGENLVIENTGTGATLDQGIVIKVATGAAVDDSTILFKNTTTDLVKIDSLGSNSTAIGEGTMQVTGGLSVTQDVFATSFNASSDATLKENIVPLQDPLRTLNKIEGYSYDWIKDEGTGPLQWGVLAQQLEEVGLDHMVSSGSVKAVNYLMLVPLLIEAVKELTRLTVDDIEDSTK